MLEPRLAIVSTGRCGTSYVAKVLRDSGIRCGHESWWTLHANPVPDLDADNSWLAVGHLDDYGGAVVHQVADPLKVLSRLQNELDESFSGEYALERQRVSGVEPSGGRPLDALRAYNRYITICEARSIYTFRVETFAEPQIFYLADLAGVERPSWERIRQALERTPTNRNTKVGQYKPLRLDDLPRGRDFDAFIENARWLGYDY